MQWTQWALRFNNLPLLKAILTVAATFTLVFKPIVAAEDGKPMAAETIQITAYGADPTHPLDALRRQGIVVTMFGGNVFPLQVPPALRAKSVTARALIEGIAQRGGLQVIWMTDGHAALLTSGTADKATAQAILKGLEDHDPAARADAAWRAGWCADVRLLAPLLKATGDADEEVSHAASQSLIRLGLVALAIHEGAKAQAFLMRVREDYSDPSSPAALALSLTGKDEAFLESLGKQALAPTKTSVDYDRNFRALGALAFGRTSIGLRTLTTATQDPRKNLQTMAVIMLSEFPADQALPVLRPLASAKDPNTRSAAVTAFGTMHSPVTLPLIRAALADTNQQVRASAAYALCEIDDPAIVPDLVKLITAGTNPNQDSLARRIGALNAPESCKELEALIASDQDDLKAVAVAALGQLPGDTGLPALRRVLQAEDVMLKRAAANALGNLEPEMAAPLLEPLTKDSDEELACCAISSLGILTRKMAVPILIQQLNDARPQTIRQTASQMLAAIDSADALAAVYKELESKDATMRLLGVIGVSKLAPDKASSMLLAATTDTDANVRVAAFVGLGQVGGPRTIPALLKGVEDPEMKVRFWTISALAQLRGAKVVAALKTASSDASEEVRAAIATGLGSIGGSEADAALKKMLGDAARPVRMAAVVAIEKQGSLQASQILLAHLKIEKDPFLYSWLLNDLKQLYSDDTAFQNQLQQLPPEITQP